jgi:hypothetical protein
MRSRHWRRRRSFQHAMSDWHVTLCCCLCNELLCHLLYHLLYDWLYDLLYDVLYEHYHLLYDNMLRYVWLSVHVFLVYLTYFWCIWRIPCVFDVFLVYLQEAYGAYTADSAHINLGQGLAMSEVGGWVWLCGWVGGWWVCCCARNGYERRWCKRSRVCVIRNVYTYIYDIHCNALKKICNMKCVWIHI